MSKKLILPKVDKEGNPYISYSQLNTWKRNKRDYIRQYFFGESFEGNDYTRFGTKVGEALEYNDFSSFTKDEQEFLNTVPRGDLFEKKVRLDLEGGVYVVGYIDSLKLHPEHKEGEPIREVISIADYKTGSIGSKVEEYASDDYNQLDIYALALQQEMGIAPYSAEVILIGREGSAFKGEELKLTKEFVEIKKEISEKRLEAVRDWVQSTTEEISEYYEVFLKINKLI